MALRGSLCVKSPLDERRVEYLDAAHGEGVAEPLQEDVVDRRRTREVLGDDRLDKAVAEMMLHGVEQRPPAADGRRDVHVEN